MTEQHPLTDDLCVQLWQDNKDSWQKLQEPFPATRRVMRAAYDLGRDAQLEQVMKWLDENLSNYTDDDYLGDCEPLHKLEGDLKKAMRSQENN